MKYFIKPERLELKIGDVVLEHSNWNYMHHIGKHYVNTPLNPSHLETFYCKDLEIPCDVSRVKESTGDVVRHTLSYWVYQITFVTASDKLIRWTFPTKKERDSVHDELLASLCKNIIIFNVKSDFDEKVTKNEL